jgi:hypothetical protein
MYSYNYPSAKVMPSVNGSSRWINQNKCFAFSLK